MTHARIALFVVLALIGCGPILHGGASPSDVSKDYEPPAEWEAGIQFHFADSTWRGKPDIGRRIYGAEVRFHDGRRERVVTGRELFYSASSSIQTPWYRVWLSDVDREIEPTLYITIGDRRGNTTVAEYPLRVMRDGFYSVYFAVYTPDSDAMAGLNPMASTTRVYDVPAGAKRVATDSLRVSNDGRPRDCFDCPL